jgi:hypothetical protein
MRDPVIHSIRHAGAIYSICGTGDAGPSPRQISFPLLSGDEMKCCKKHDCSFGVNSDQRIEAQAEIRDFLRALDSYPAQFAQNAALSFADYFNIVAKNARLGEVGEA